MAMKSYIMFWVLTWAIFSLCSTSYAAPDAGGQTRPGQRMAIDLHNDAAPNPLILVPGIMGSTDSELSGGLYPRLKKEFGTLDTLILHDPLKSNYGFLDFSPGWQDLKDLLTGSGIRVVDCPWDWRRPMEVCVREYLMPAIARAQNGNPGQKVNIVAHSMGGLLVRAYIQSDLYRGEIDNFTMVGTPNAGSTDAYFIWEGGDPHRVDAITDRDTPLEDGVDFNWHTTRLLFDTYYNWVRLSYVQNYVIRKFVQDNIPAVKELLPTYGFLKTGKNPVAPISTQSVNYNSFLADLNADPRRFERMGKPTDVARVKVRVYAGKSTKTMKDLAVRVKPAANLYEDGYPSNPKLTRIGDGTVPAVSATLPCAEGWAELKTAKGGHAFLIRENRGAIVRDLYPELFSRTGRERSAPSARKRHLYLGYRGRLRLALTDPEGRRLGIDPDSGLPLEEIAGGRATMGANYGAIVISEPPAGIYEITVKDGYAEDYILILNYLEGDGTVIREYRGMGNGTTRLTLNIRSGPKPIITVSHSPEAPTGLRAGRVEPGLTGLTWEKSGDKTVTGYRVYARRADEPFFSLLGSTDAATTSLTTSLPWGSEPGAGTWLFAVTAIQGDTGESFLSNPTDNGASRLPFPVREP